MMGSPSTRGRDCVQGARTVKRHTCALCRGSGASLAHSGSTLGQGAASKLAGQSSHGNQAILARLNSSGPAGAGVPGSPQDIQLQASSIASQCVEAQCQLDLMLTHAQTAQAAITSLDQQGFLSGVKAAQVGLC
jgi:hypothetical protein